MLTNIPPKTSINIFRNKKINIPKISLNLGASNFGNIKSSGTKDSESFKIKKGKKMRMHDYQKMGISTLEGLLTQATKLQKQMTEAVKILPDDKNLEKLDKLQSVIQRLKQQIESRR